MNTSLLPPDRLFGELFYAVQNQRIFADTKTFVDSVPKMPPEAILTLYEEKKAKPEFNLKVFVQENFILPSLPAADFASDTRRSTAEHIHHLWDYLTRPGDEVIQGSSRLPLPYPYVVPGGRFREIFYWDSYFTMLGLAKSGRTDLIRHMVDNFAYLIDTCGFIPNGNRTYFLSRSQPPFFVLMVRLLAGTQGPDIWLTYRHHLEKEYRFWMNSSEQLTQQNPVNERVVRLPDGNVLNRYFDPVHTPRSEAYPKEMPLTEEARRQGVSAETLHSHLRAACESGWDFSSRWLADGADMVTNQCADLLPVDLNCLLYELERTLGDIWQDDPARARQFAEMAERRRKLIQTLFWDEDRRFFFDYHFVGQQRTTPSTLAAVFPLFVKIATPEQAAHVHARLRDEFLQSGGLVTTLVRSGQQWDAPNGWAPLQWLAYVGLKNYGFDQTADEVRRRWLALNDHVYEQTGKLTEKYNVMDVDAPGGGGNYPNQDGFGWTNGVYLALSDGTRI